MTKIKLISSAAIGSHLQTSAVRKNNITVEEIRKKQGLTVKALLSAGWVFTYRFAGEPGKCFNISLDNVIVNV
jgi:hypothetical protein